MSYTPGDSFDMDALFKRHGLNDDHIQKFRESEIDTIDVLLMVTKDTFLNDLCLKIGAWLKFSKLQEELKNAAPAVPIHNLKIESNSPAIPKSIAVLDTKAETELTVPHRPNRDHDSLINKLIKQTGATIADNLLKCAYSAFFPAYPSDETIDLWIQAFREREKVGLCASEADKVQHHREANNLVAKALGQQFWLPYRYACVWKYFPNKLAYIIYRIEYEALTDILTALEKEGRLRADQVALHAKLRTIISDLSSKDQNSFRLSVIGKTDCDKNSCMNSPNSFLGCTHCFCSPVNVNSKNYVFLGPNIKEWDPDITFKLVYNWPAPASSNDKLAPHPFAETTPEIGEVKKYFVSSVTLPYVKKFKPFPKEFFVKCDSAMKGLAPPADIRLQDLYHVFGELMTLRNVAIGHSRVTYTAQDVWWVFSSILMAANISLLQAEEWLRLRREVRLNLHYFPTANSSQSLHDSSRTVLNGLLETMDDILQDYTHPVSPVNGNIDAFDIFVRGINKYEPNGKFLLLILPPLTTEQLPGSFAAVPWNLVLDLSDLSSGQDVTASPAWTVFTDALTSNGEVKQGHRKFIFNERRIVRKELRYLEDFMKDNQSGCPWWHVTVPEARGCPDRLLSELFDEDGLFRDKDGVERVRESIYSVIDCIMKPDVLKNRCIQVVIPMYGVFEMPMLNERGKYYFSKNLTDKTMQNNFAFPYILQRLLRRLTDRRGVSTDCLVLHEHENMLAQSDKLFHFLTSGEDYGFKLSDSCHLNLLRLPPEILKMRYRFYYLDANDAVTNYGDSVCIYTNEGSLYPFVAVRNVTTSSTRATDREEFRDREESIQNLTLLKSCGIDLLHLQSPTMSLAEFESSSIFSAFLNERRKKTRSFSQLEISPQAFAVIKFYFSYPPSWALFDEKVMRQDANLFQGFVTSRPNMMAELRRKAEMLWRSRRTSTLVVNHVPRTGATTLIRQFAWTVAFNEWNAVVLVLTDRFVSSGEDSIKDVMRVLTCCLPPQSQLLLIADRHVSNEALRTFCTCLTNNTFSFLLIRLQHTYRGGSTEKDSDNSPRMGGVVFGKLESLQLHSPTNDDIINVATSMFQLTKYFDPTVDVNRSLEKFKKGEELDARFKRIFFVGLLKFVSSTNLRESREAQLSKSVYLSVIKDWMSTVVGRLYAKIDEEMASSDQAPNTTSTLAAMRSLMYLALVQLSSNNDLPLDLNSFRIVFNDPQSSTWLFKAWETKNIEASVMKRAYTESLTRLEKKKSFSPVYGSLLPFFETLSVPSYVSSHSKNNYTDLSGSTGLFLTSQFQKIQSTLSDAASQVLMTNEPKSNGPDDIGFRSWLDPVPTPIPNTSMEELYSSLLEIPSTPTLSEVGRDRAGGGQQSDKLDDIGDLLWGEFLKINNGLVQFISPDVAEVFLQEAFKMEADRYPCSNTSASFDSISPAHVYILAMSLLYTINNDPDTVQTLKNQAHVDILHSGGDYDASLAWCAQHMLVERQQVFATESIQASHKSSTNPYQLLEGSHADYDSKPSPNGKGNASSSKFLPKYQQWSWVIVKLYRGIENFTSSSLEEADEIVEEMRMSPSSSLFSSYDMKLLIASQSVFTGYWRVSSTTSRLMQYYLLAIVDKIHLLGVHFADFNVSALNTLFREGAKLFLASSARLILAVDEINRTLLSTGKGEGDRKKFSGTMDQVGNCIKAFLCLNREAMLAKCQAFSEEMAPYHKDGEVVMFALGNMARYFYGLSVRVVSQPLGFGDEVDCWLHVLEGCKGLQSLYSKGNSFQQEMLAPGLEHRIYSLSDLPIDTRELDDLVTLFTGSSSGWLQSSSQNDAIYDTFVKNTYFASRIITIKDTVDEAHSKLEEFHNANLRSTQDNTSSDYLYFDQNWNRESMLMDRLGAIVAGSSGAQPWRSQFIEKVKYLHSLQSSSNPIDRTTIPYLERSIARFAYCMWRTSASDDGSDDYSLSTRLLYRKMVELNNTQEGCRHIQQVLSCIIHCMNKLPLQYPHRLMVQLFDLLSFITPKFLELKNQDSDNFSLFPFTVERLYPIVLKWQAAAANYHRTKQSDLTSYAVSLRYAAILVFMKLWKYAKARCDSNNAIGRERPTDERELLTEMARLNGECVQDMHSSGSWRPGCLNNDYKSYIHSMAPYVLVHPIDMPESKKSCQELPLCIREQFSIIDEGRQERNDWPGHLEPDSEDVYNRFKQILVYGVVSHINVRPDGHWNGVVKLHESELRLPFSYDSQDVLVLQKNKLAPQVDAACSFYIKFLPWRVEAHAVQRHLDTEDRVCLSDLYVSESKNQQIAKNDERYRRIHHVKRNKDANGSVNNVNRLSDNIPVPAPATVSTPSANQQEDNVQDTRKNAAVAATPTTGSSWGTKKSTVFRQDASALALQLKAENEQKVEGLSFPSLFPDDFNVWRLEKDANNNAFHSLHDFQGEDIGTTLHMVAVSEFFASDVEAKTVPTKILSRICGVIADSMIFLPYMRLERPFSADCGYVLVPARSDVLPLENEMKETSKRGYLKLLFEEVASSEFDTSIRLSELGTVRGTQPLTPKLPADQDAKDIPLCQLQRKMFFLLHLPTMSLAAAREGLLVLMPQRTYQEEEEKCVDDYSKLDLGLVYFSRFASAEDVCSYISTLWSNCQRCIESTVTWSTDDPKMWGSCLGSYIEGNIVQDTVSLKYSPTTARPTTIMDNNNLHPNLKKESATSTLPSPSKVSKTPPQQAVAAPPAPAPSVPAWKTAPANLSIAGNTTVVAANSSWQQTPPPIQTRSSTAASTSTAATTTNATAGAAARDKDGFVQVVSQKKPSQAVSSGISSATNNTALPPICTECGKKGHIVDRCPPTVCKFRFACREGINCRDKHTILENRLFEELKNDPKRLKYKFSTCKSAKAHTPKDCQYFHNGVHKSTDKYCTRCLTQGHMEVECPHKH